MMVEKSKWPVEFSKLKNFDEVKKYYDIFHVGFRNCFLQLKERDAEVEKLKKEIERLQKVNLEQSKWLYQEQIAHEQLREKVSQWLKEKE